MGKVLFYAFYYGLLVVYGFGFMLLWQWCFGFSTLSRILFFFGCLVAYIVYRYFLFPLLLVSRVYVWFYLNLLVYRIKKALGIKKDDPQ